MKENGLKIDPWEWDSRSGTRGEGFREELHKTPTWNIYFSGIFLEKGDGIREEG